MKPIKFILFLFVLLAGNQVSAQIYTPSDNESAVKFTIKNFGFGVNGSFKNLKGTIIFDPANLAGASFKVTIDAATINTGNNSRDGHLKKEEYFDVAKYPKISFTSNKIDKTAQGYLVSGVFTIRDKSKMVMIPFTAIPQNGGYLFNGKVQLNRRDFGVGGSSMVLSDNLILMLTVKALK